ncbi:MAG: hypothetical protein OQK04_03175, partial [Kangiellaceae bacterium]|nr:hypothetical protein [Kangiellaceae bacterium]
FSDYEILLAALLEENSSRFTYRNSKGNQVFDELKEFKALESIYIKNVDAFETDLNSSVTQLKTIMFFSFYSLERNSAAFQEYLASDLMPIYLRNKKAFLEILRASPFLIAANCNRLNAFFGFEGLNKNKKSLFLDENKNMFFEALDKEEFKLCWSSFK